MLKNIIKKHNSLGIDGENIAVKYLLKNNYRIIKKNFKNITGKIIGEIDIIAEKNNVLVFIEVKTRSYINSTPDEHIDKKKILKLSKIINFYISKNNLWNREYRLDAISIIVDKLSNKHKIIHKENIFL